MGAQKKVYTVNLDPAVRNLAYPVTLDTYGGYDRHVKLGKMIRHWPGKSSSLRCKISRETVIQQKLESYPSGPRTTFSLYGLSKLQIKHIRSTSTFHHKVASVKVASLFESRNIDIRDSVNYKEVMKHFGLGPNGAIMILGLPVLFFFVFFGSPLRWKMVSAM